jgi:tetratricopeptide (TPR) repeat protein
MPQHAKRIKLRRKDLRGPDEFETLTGQAVAWAEDHGRLVAAVVAGAVGIAAVSLMVGYWRADRDRAAATAFQAAHETFTAARYPEAIDEFARVASDYPRAPYGRLAGLYRAHALARQGDAAAAATAYGEYLASSPPTDYLRQEALAGLGRAKEAAGDSAGAIEAYGQAGALEGPFRTDALLGAARLHEAASQPDRAREIYAGLLKDASDPDLRALLSTKVPAAAAEATPALEPNVR